MRRTGSVSVSLSSTRPCQNSCSHSGRSCDKFLVLPHSYSHFLLMLDAPREPRFPAMKMLGEVGEDEVEELVDRPGTTKGT